MSIEKGRAYFRALGMEDRVREFTVSSATVELAALALGVEGARIAKTLSFKTAEGKTRFSKGETPFQPDNVRMVREIGIFLIAIPAVQFIMSIVARIALGPDMVESSLGMSTVFMGLVVLALSQYFAYGMKLQNDVDGLL